MKTFDKITLNEHSLKRIYKRYYTFLGPLMGQPKARAYTFLGISLLTVAFFIFFAIRPTINTIIGLQKQIQDDREVEKKLQEKINALSQLQAEYEIIQPDLPVLDAALPVAPEVSDLIKTAEKLAGDNQASLSAMQVSETMLSEDKKDTLDTAQKTAANKNKPAGVSKPSTATPISMVFTTETDYVNVIKMISAINRLPRLYSLQSVTMLKGLRNIVFNLKTNAYYLPFK